MKRLLALAAICLLGFPAGAATESAPFSTLHRHAHWREGPEDAQPSIDGVMRKALERLKEAYARYYYQGKHTYTQLLVVEQLGRDGSVMKREEKRYQVYPIAGVPYFRLIQKDGRPLTAAERKAQQEQERRFRHELAQGQHREETDEYQEFFQEELIRRYHFELVSQEPVNGRPAFVVRFAPHRGDLPERRRLDPLLNKMAGTVWIDQQAYEIVRGEFRLTGEVKVWWGIVAGVRRLEGGFEQKEVDAGMWGPSRFHLYIQGRVLFRPLHERQQMIWDWREAG